MNILYLHRTQGEGVESVHIREIANSFTMRGHHVDIIGPTKNLTLETQLECNDKKQLQTLFWKFLSKHLPEFLFELLEICYNISAFKKIKRAFKRKKYDFIYERYAIFSFAPVLFAKKNKIPIILEVNYTSYTPLYRKRSALLKPLAYILDSYIFKNATGIYVVSSNLKRHIGWLGVGLNRIIVLTNAADPDVFNPEKVESDIRFKLGLKSKKIIGYVGGFYPWHGLEFLIKGLVEVRKDVPNVFCLLIGDGRQRPYLENMVKKTGIDQSVIFTGNVTHQDLSKYIAAFDIAVLPHFNDYGSPMKIFEYMSMAKPVIVPRAENIEESMEDGKEGIMFEERDIKGLVNALVTVLKNDNLRIQMGIKGRENICTKNNWMKKGEAILQLYEKVRIMGFPYNTE